MSVASLCTGSPWASAHCVPCPAVPRLCSLSVSSLSLLTAFFMLSFDEALNPTDVFFIFCQLCGKYGVFCALCLAGLQGLHPAWVCLLTADFFCCSLPPDSFLLLLLHLSLSLLSEENIFFPTLPTLNVYISTVCCFSLPLLCASIQTTQ